MKHLIDAHNRPITYLRLSITDKCQFRCVYCVAPSGTQTLNRFPRREILSPDQMEHFVRAVSAMGVTKLRLTGGEPLLRPDILNLIARFSSVPHISDLALSTNGEFLAPIAHDLKAVGLKRINISLDSLNPGRFLQLTQSRAYKKVILGLEKALEAGLEVKINVVALPGLDEPELEAFAKLALEHPLEVRFIEFMPLCGSAWDPKKVVPIAEVRQFFTRHFILHEKPRGSEVAQSFGFMQGYGSVGFIGSLTEPFCGQCSRIRMDAYGRLQLCLFSPVHYDIGHLIREFVPLEVIQNELSRVVLKKQAGHPYQGHNRHREQPAHNLMQAMGG